MTDRRLKRLAAETCQGSSTPPVNVRGSLGLCGGCGCWRNLIDPSKLPPPAEGKSPGVLRLRTHKVPT